MTSAIPEIVQRTFGWTMKRLSGILSNVAGQEFTKILITTDLSDEAVRAYPYARSLASAYGATILLLTCIDTSMQLAVGSSVEMPVMYVPETIAAMKETTLSELARHLKNHFPGEPPEYVVREAAMPVHHIIADFIKECGANLVVMSSHGRSGLKRTVMGSVTEQVLRSSTKPVLVVPARGG